MKRILLGLALALALGASVQASPVILQTGDSVKFNGAVSGASEGNGGAFSWQLTGTVSGPPSSPIGTNFDTFCTELQQNINNGSTYTIGSLFTPSTGGTINSSGNILQNMKGVYLFDLWSNNLLSSYTSSWGSAAVAGAVQYELWASEGYTSAQISSTGGLSGSLFNSASADAAILLGVTDVNGAYSSSWAPTDVSAFILTHNGGPAQDQIVLVPSNGQQTGSPATPEPTSMIVWGVGAGLAGAAAARRGTRRRGKWTKQNRQAILAVIERGRNLPKP
jgi:hypothetical protein